MMPKLASSVDSDIDTLKELKYKSNIRDSSCATGFWNIEELNLYAQIV